MDETEKRQFEADLAKRGLELGEHVRLARTIQAPAADVWKVISKPGELNKYHPYCRENIPVYKWPSVGSRDGVSYYSGLYFERDFIYWREGAGYDLQISPSPKDGVDLLEFATAWGTQSELSLTVTPILESYLVETTKKSYMQTYFGKSIEVYLDSLLRGVEQFVTTGQEVKPHSSGPTPCMHPECKTGAIRIGWLWQASSKVVASPLSVFRGFWGFFGGSLRQIHCCLVFVIGIC